MSAPAAPEATFACPPSPAVLLVAVQWRSVRTYTRTHGAWRSTTNAYDCPARTLCGKRVYDASTCAAEDRDGRPAVEDAIDCAACRRILRLTRPCDQCGRERRSSQHRPGPPQEDGTDSYPRWLCGTCEHRELRRANTAELYGRGRRGY